MNKKAFSLGLMLLGIFIALFIWTYFPLKKDSLEFITFEPKMPGVIKLREPLKIHYSYEINSTSEAKVYANFFFQGKECDPYSYTLPGDSIVLKEGKGTAFLEVYFTDVMKIDKIELYVLKIDAWSLIKRAWSTSFDNITIKVPIKTNIEIVP